MELEASETVDFGAPSPPSLNVEEEPEAKTSSGSLLADTNKSVPSLGQAIDDDDDNKDDGENVVAEKEKKKKPTFTPMEIAQGDDDEDSDDMESLLPGGAPTQKLNTKKLNNEPTNSYLNGWIRPQRIGNMHILFPEYFNRGGWGVLGPQWFGPACVWGLLVIATHFCLRRSRMLGPISVLLSYIFFAVATYLLTDVSFRDPGICLDTQIPDGVPADQARGWRWCDFCKVYQPPDGAHCPDCNVCVAGYDHHCVWMGTCIGKKNYKQFVKFNISWLYYAGYGLFWLALFGPLVKHVKV